MSRPLFAGRPEGPLAHATPDCPWRRYGEPVPHTAEEATRALAVGIERCPACVLRLIP